MIDSVSYDITKPSLRSRKNLQTFLSPCEGHVMYSSVVIGLGSVPLLPFYLQSLQLSHHWIQCGMDSVSHATKGLGRIMLCICPLGGYKRFHNSLSAFCTLAPGTVKERRIQLAENVAHNYRKPIPAVLQPAWAARLSSCPQSRQDQPTYLKRSINTVAYTERVVSPYWSSWTLLSRCYEILLSPAA